MTEFAQLVEKFGIPYGVLLSAIIVLWREVQRLRTKNEELHDRLEKRAPEAVPEDKLQQIVDASARMESAVRKLVSRAGQATKGTEGTKG